MGKYAIEEIPLVIMVGQSNCGGNNDDSLNATITGYANGNIYFKPDWTSTDNGYWATTITTNVNNNQYTRIPGFSDIGAELNLAKLLYDYTSKEHYFIKLSYGGAELTDTIGQDDLNPANTGEHWTVAVDYTMIHAIEKLVYLGKVKIKAITFHQGESDCYYGTTVANNYYQPAPAAIDKDNPLPFFFQEFRNSISNLNEVKAVITKIVMTTQPTERPIIQQSQIDFCNDHEWAYLNDMEGSVAYSDGNIHWDAPTQELKAANIFNIIKDW